MKSLRTLLNGIVDYAGLFPPAALDMTGAVHNYHSYRQSEHGWALSRFVVPVSQLDKFEQAAATVWSGEGSPWRLSALIGSDVRLDIDHVNDFNASFSGSGVGAMIIDAVEVKVANAGAVRDVAGMAPDGIDAFFEVPIATDPSAMIDAIAEAGAKAKVRTGGITESMIPSVENVIRFMERCRAAKLAFKATAGLHHPMRGNHNLTYEAKSPMGHMHGFLNVFLAACFLRAGMPRDDATRFLDEPSAASMQFDETGVDWHSHRVGVDEIAACREEFALAFGSCSFEEPMQELKGLGLL